MRHGTGFEQEQVNNLQIQYEQEGFRIMSRENSTGSSGGGVIDGRYSSSFYEHIEAGYVAVEVSITKQRVPIALQTESLSVSLIQLATNEFTLLSKFSDHWGCTCVGVH